MEERFHPKLKSNTITFSRDEQQAPKHTDYKRDVKNKETLIGKLFKGERSLRKKAVLTIQKKNMVYPNEKVDVELAVMLTDKMAVVLPALIPTSTQGLRQEGSEFQSVWATQQDSIAKGPKQNQKHCQA